MFSWGKPSTDDSGIGVRCAFCGCDRRDVEGLARWHNINPATAQCCEVLPNEPVPATTEL